MYNDKVLEAFRNPKNVGRMEDADAEGMVTSPSCGDMMKLYLKIENDVIVDAKFETFGCAAAIASSSTATQMIIGKTLVAKELFGHVVIIKRYAHCVTPFSGLVSHNVSISFSIFAIIVLNIVAVVNSRERFFWQFLFFLKGWQ